MHLERAQEFRSPSVVECDALLPGIVYPSTGTRDVIGEPRMPKLTEITTYDDVMHSFSWDSLWALFDGDRDCMNLAHECIDRHRDQGIAISVKFADGHSEHYDYAVLADLSGRFANWLT